MSVDGLQVKKTWLFWEGCAGVYALTMAASAGLPVLVASSNLSSASFS